MFLWNSHATPESVLVSKKDAMEEKIAIIAGADERNRQAQLKRKILAWSSRGTNNNVKSC